MTENRQISLINPEGIRTEDLPDIIAGTYDNIRLLEGKQKEAKGKAERARMSVIDAKRKVTLFNKRERIESLQNAGIDLAEAVDSLSDAQKQQFEYQKNLTNACRYLFLIGATNMAHCQSIRQELQLKMQNASDEELSEFAQQEIINTINQLKEQERVLNEQAGIIKRLDKKDKEIDELQGKINKQEEIIKKQQETIGADIKELRKLQEDMESKNDDTVRQIASLNERITLIKQKQKERNAELNDKVKGSGEKIDELSQEIDVANKNVEEKIIMAYKRAKIAVCLLGTTSFAAILLSILDILNVF